MTSDQSYTTAFVTDRTPDEVFATINDVRGWWTGEIEGTTDGVGAEFTYVYGDIHRSRQQVTELVPGKRVVWRVVDADISFTQDRAEWIGTEIVFDINGSAGGTEVRFTHVGLVSGLECYDQCSGAWSFLVNGSLRKAMTEGK